MTRLPIPLSPVPATFGDALSTTIDLASAITVSAALGFALVVTAPVVVGLLVRDWATGGRR